MTVEVVFNKIILKVTTVVLIGFFLSFVITGILHVDMFPAAMASGAVFSDNFESGTIFKTDNPAGKWDSSYGTGSVAITSSSPIEGHYSFLEKNSGSGSGKYVERSLGSTYQWGNVHFDFSFNSTSAISSTYTVVGAWAENTGQGSRAIYLVMKYSGGNLYWGLRKSSTASYWESTPSNPTPNNVYTVDIFENVTGNYVVLRVGNVLKLNQTTSLADYAPAYEGCGVWASDTGGVGLSIEVDSVKFSDNYPPSDNPLSINSPTNQTYSSRSFSVDLSCSDPTCAVTFNVKNGSAWVYGFNQTYSTPTSLSGFVNGTYVFYAWAINSTSTIEATVSFTVSVSDLSHFTFTVVGAENYLVDVFYRTDIAYDGGTPVLIFSIGGGYPGLSVADYIPMLQFMALRGYVVCAANTNPTTPFSPTGILRQTEAEKLIIDYISTPSFRLHGAVNLARIGAFGHSRGTSVINQAALDTRIKTILGLVVGNETICMNASSYVNVPAFLIFDTNDTFALLNDNVNYYNHFNSSKGYVQIQGASHDLGIWNSAPYAAYGFVPINTTTTPETEKYLLAWFNYYLKGENNATAYSIFSNASSDTNIARWKYFDVSSILSVTLNSPTDGFVSSSPAINFFYTPTVSGTLDFRNSTLWVNGNAVTWTTGPIYNATINTISTVLPGNGAYNWNIQVWNGKSGVLAATNRTLTVASYDLTPPVIGTITVNSTIEGTAFRASANVTDNSAVSGYIWSINNGSGYVNQTWTHLTSNPVIYSSTWTWPAGTQVSLILYANDTSNNWTASLPYNLVIASNILFNSGFEEGAISTPPWTGQTSSGTTVAVQNSIKHSGSYALQVSGLNVAGDYSFSYVGISGTEFTASEWYMFNETLPTAMSTYWTLTPRFASTAGTTYLVADPIYNFATQKFGIRYWGPTGTVITYETGTSPISIGVWYHLTLYVKSADAGALMLWVGTSLKLTVNVDTNTRTLGYVCCGGNYLQVQESSSKTIVVDDFEVRIGCIPPGSGGNPIDVTPPVFTSMNVNSTKENSIAQFSCVIIDDFGVSSYLPCWNLSGYWENLTATAFTNNPATFTRTLNILAGNTVTVKFYANDTSGNWGVSAEYDFMVTSSSSLIFSSGFEEGRILIPPWSGSTSSGTTLTVQNSTMHDGSYALQISGLGTSNDYGFAYSGLTGNEFTASEWYMFNESLPAATSSYWILTPRFASTIGTSYLVADPIYNFVTHKFGIRYYGTGGVVVVYESGVSPISANTWYLLTLYINSADAGSISLWVGNSLKLAINADTNTRPLGYACFGANYVQVNETADRTIEVDDVQVNVGYVPPK